MSKPLVGTVVIAERLNISRRKLTDMCIAKKIPHVIIGGVYKFDPDKIELWIEERSVEARA